MKSKAPRRRRPTPAQIFDTALALNERGSLKHTEAQLDGALACLLIGFDDKTAAAEIVASAIARAFSTDAEIEKAAKVPEMELAAAINSAIGDALLGKCPCCGEAFESTSPAPKAIN